MNISIALFKIANLYKLKINDKVVFLYRYLDVLKVVYYSIGMYFKLKSNVKSSYS